MEVLKSGLFRAAYFLYTNTSAGYYYHAHNLATAERKFRPNDIKAHSKETHFDYGPISVHVIPFCMDNYCYIVVDTVSLSALVVDPGDATPVVDFFARNTNYKPIAILCTHKHWDHCAGNGELLEKYPHLEIFASEDDGAYLSNRTFRDSEEIALGQGLFGSASITAYEMPGHTVGHALFCISPVSSNRTAENMKIQSNSRNDSIGRILSLDPDFENESLTITSYQHHHHGTSANKHQTIPTITYNGTGRLGENDHEEITNSADEIQDEATLPPLLFTGDCLFMNGIGKMFECPSVVMAATLQRIMDIFPDTTLVWPGHEYTMTFVKFTLNEIEPENEVLQERFRKISELTEQKLPTVPSLFKTEKECNPFLRTAKLSSENKDFMKKSPSDILQILADRKDKFAKSLNANSPAASSSEFVGSNSN